MLQNFRSFNQSSSLGKTRFLQRKCRKQIYCVVLMVWRTSNGCNGFSVNFTNVIDVINKIGTSISRALEASVHLFNGLLLQSGSGIFGRGVLLLIVGVGWGSIRRLARRVPVVDVLAERAGVGKSLETFFTLERFFSSVQTQVLNQVMLVLELLGARIARPGTLICKME